MASSEYGKIIVGEPVDDSTPLIATGYRTDPEAAQAIPMYYRSGSTGPSSDAYQVGYEHSQPQTDTIIYDRDPGEDCAQIGCLLSWIPIIGIITCCVNMDAPSDSPRAYWSRIAFGISCVVIALNIVYFMTY
jgi:hypothetical protein